MCFFLTVLDQLGQFFAILFFLLDVDCFNLYNTHQPDPREESVGVGGQFNFPDRHKLHSSLCEVSGV